MKKEFLKKELGLIKEQYNNIKYDISILESVFFSDQKITKKYGEWNYKEGRRTYKKTSKDLENELDEEDLEKLISFYSTCMAKIKDKKNELEERENEGEIIVHWDTLDLDKWIIKIADIYIV